MAVAPKILVLRFSSIGDIILTTPVFRMLKIQLNAEVHLLTKSKFAFAVDGNPHIDHIHTIERDVMEKVDALRHLDFDFLIDLHNNLRSLIFKSMLGVPSTAVRKLNLEKWVLVNLKRDIMPKRPHMVLRNIETLIPLGIVDDENGMDFFIPESAQVDVSGLGEGNLKSGHYAAMAIRTSTSTRSLEEWQLAQIAAQSAVPIALLGSEADREIGDRVAADNSKVVNLAGLLSLQQSASVIGQSAVLITPDTSLMHIGAALGHPMITIWGNTNERFGMTPWYAKESDSAWEMVEVKGLSCRPCSKIGFDTCPKGHFRCIRDLDIVYIAQRVRQLTPV